MTGEVVWCHLPRLDLSKMPRLDLKRGVAGNGSGLARPQ